MTTLFGLQVIESPYIGPVPVIQLRLQVPCSDEFRCEMNAWLLEMFGTKEVVYFLPHDPSKIFMHPSMAARLEMLRY